MVRKCGNLLVHVKDDVSQSVTQVYSEKKFPSAPNRSRIYGLPISTSDALPLSNGRLVVARPLIYYYILLYNARYRQFFVSVTFCCNQTVKGNLVGVLIARIRVLVLTCPSIFVLCISMHLPY